MDTSSPMENKEVVIIGNGPSAITLSYLLAGNWPYYRSDAHPNEELHYRLRNPDPETEWTHDGCSLENVSIVERDLEYLSSGLEGRSKNPVSVLFDALVHPEADFGTDQPSTLEWEHKPDKFVDHIVVGKGRPGGAWDKMEDCTETLTVSLRNWMELPSMSVKEWSRETKRSESRVSLSTVAKYYRDYVHRQGLRKHFKNHSEVTEVRFNYNTELWEVSGFQKCSGNFRYQSPKVVLATGNSDVPNKLNVPGEDLPFILHSLNELENLLKKTISSEFEDPILIVGGGLSAADAVLTTRFRRVPVVHAFRKHSDDPRLIFNQLPENMYPEYHKVHSMMKGQSYTTGYKNFSMHAVQEIKESREVVLKNLISSGVTAISCYTTIKVSFVLILVGMKPNLKFLKPKSIRKGLATSCLKDIDVRDNPIKINAFTHETLAATGMYAVGPLVGDNFVRFVQGSALAITNSIWRHKVES